MKTKFCGKCRKIKDVDEFWKDKRAKDKLTSWCKDCRREAKKLYYEKKPLTDEQKAKLKQQQQAWMEKNKARYLYKKKLSKRRARARAREMKIQVPVFRTVETIDFDEVAWKQKYQVSMKLILSKRT